MKYSDLVERDIEAAIDNELRYLKWNDDSKDINSCNRNKKKLLGGKRPDYILYKDNSDEPIAIIEAKKPYEDINKAQQQGIEYAKILNAPVVFATDGIYTKTYHIKKQANLTLNNEEVDDLLNQSTLLNFLQDNIYDSIDKIRLNRQKGFTIKRGINIYIQNYLFSNILFLKVISELAEMNDCTIALPPKDYLWDNFKIKKGLDLVDFLNKQAFDYFKKSYGGKVLSKIEILSGKERILNDIITNLDDLWLSDTNTDIKGDAFEYFLRNYGGAETDFGEYFTPRHIVKTMVKLLNPKFGEKIYDGFCGTGGMLTESFKYIKRRMPLNPNTIRYLKNETVFGGEFSTIFRIAKMNMILAGDGHSNIARQDSYEKKQTNKLDVVITNIPFGNKMKTDYLSQYGYNGKSAEICGVLHCLDALNNQNENARAGIIVPEEEAKQKQNHIWYFDLQNDGYALNKARTKIKGQNDIDVLLSEASLNIDEIERLKRINFDVLYKNKVRNNKYVLLANQYKEQVIDNFAFQEFSLQELEEIKHIEFKKGNALSKTEVENDGIYECILYGELYTKYNNPFIDKVYSTTNVKGKILSNYGDVQNKINPQYLSLVFNYTLKNELAKYARGANILHLSNDNIKKIKIPLPPLEEQQKIVEEIDSYQKVIDGAKQIIDNWNPSFEVREGCEIRNLGDITKLVRGPFGGSLKKEIFVESGFKVYEQSNCIKNDVKIGNYYITESKYKEMIRFSVQENDILMSCSGTIGKVLLLNNNFEKGIINQALLKVTPAQSSKKKIVEQIENERKIVESSKQLIKLQEEKIKNKINLFLLNSNGIDARDYSSNLSKNDTELKAKKKNLGQDDFIIDNKSAENIISQLEEVNKLCINNCGLASQNHEFATQILNNLFTNVNLVMGDIWNAYANYSNNLISSKNLVDMNIANEQLADNFLNIAKQVQLINAQVMLDCCNELVAPSLKQAASCSEKIAKKINSN
ncbi:type I restriction-modification system methyltransferase subunit [Reticulomyxa filosa]|uniref:site-specific DNA-methyltransferase (adenine-specific) n=1 Tax=Reticulomyxa filosa TaxID=46433 RepID=X6N8F5_RETFI|nr:type I restriction-modification system methyltransferase subunit [Reticulomyxa filosa]|eukprot:ETO22024.1 type I restriction-modification system methyltransferase subunit [Reticulomyxa filosa]